MTLSNMTEVDGRMRILVMGVGKGAFVATSLKIPVFRNAFYPSAFPIISVGGGYAF